MTTPTTELWRLTATEAFPLLKSGELKVETYARSLLDRIKERDAQVQAWVWLKPEQVLAAARQLDDLPADKRGPLFGLPIGIKDVILTKDMPTQYNSRLYTSDEPIRLDANVVQTLRASGALLFGKTSTTEFATSKQGNWHQNLTRNPLDPARTPGGSSSGSGAAVADFQVPLALGTQTGGSIVRPASFTGCVGWKPTWGAVSREGLAQWCITLDTCGFFARTVPDLEILADAFRIHDDDDAEHRPFELRGAKIGFFESSNWPNAGPGTVKAMAKAQELLKAKGAIVEKVSVPEDFDYLLDWHHDILVAEGRTSFLGQYLTDKTQLHYDIVGYVEDSKDISNQDLLETYDGLAALRPMWDNIAGEYAVIITPSVPDEAPLGTDTTGNMRFCSSWTALHAPAINLPGFAGENGLPIGLTAVAPRYQDRHLLHVSAALQKVFEEEGGWEREKTKA